ncbi:DUF1847 domain-containing protein [Chloroflexota bacterium]
MKRMPEVIEKAISEYDNPEVKEFARLASLQEFECYEHLPDGRRTKNPWILELIQFAQKCGYKKLGIAFCGGLANEIRMLTEVLNTENADLAIMLGLCIGHDTLFIKYCRVPMTVKVVKDRVTGHNPLAALYLSNSYYKRLMTKVK